MAKAVFRYTIHRVGVSRALVKGTIRARSLNVVVKKLQRQIKKDVLKRHIPAAIKVWNVKDPLERFEGRFESRRDFKRSKKTRPKWRRELSRRVKYSSTFDPEPKVWFVAVGKRGQISLTKLAYEPAKKTLLRRKRKKMFGPFETEEKAQEFIRGLEEKIEERRKTTIQER